MFLNTSLNRCWTELCSMSLCSPGPHCFQKPNFTASNWWSDHSTILLFLITYHILSVSSHISCVIRTSGCGQGFNPQASGCFSPSCAAAFQCANKTCNSPWSETQIWLRHVSNFRKSFSHSPPSCSWFNGSGHSPLYSHCPHIAHGQVCTYQNWRGYLLFYLLLASGSYCQDWMVMVP